MKFWPHITLAFFLILTMLCSVEAKRITSFEKRPSCEKSGGVWRQFGNACGDGCLAKFNQFTMCAQALTYACDCLEDRCFDGKRCVAMNEYKTKYDEIKNHEQELLNNLKEARQDEYNENRQRIMQNLFGTPPEEKNNAQNLEGVENQQNTQPNNNLSKPAGFQPIQAVIANPISNRNADFKVPPFFAKQQEDKKIADIQTGDSDSKKSVELPNIPLPNL